MDAHMASQQIQFYQYRPDSEARHNAVFTPLPSEQPVYGSMMAYPSAHFTAPQYWQPPQHPHHAHFNAQRILTPNGSPPLTLAMPTPKIVVDQNGQMDHGRFFHSASPPTPCLSACPSTASSPPASAIQQTPVHGPGYFSLPIESFKEDLQVQSFPVVESWDETNQVVHIPSNDAKLFALDNSPSMSPATPESQSPSSAFPVAEFVNLRDLTSGSFEVPAVTPTSQACPPLPTLSTEDEEHKITFGATSLPMTPEHDLAESFSVENPSFESSFCSELDSEEDQFSFVNFGETDVVFNGDKRLKLSTDDNFDIESFDSFDEEDCARHGLPSPPSSLFSESACCGTKAQRKMSKRPSPDNDADSQTSPQANNGASSSHNDGQQVSASTSQSQSSSTDGNALNSADQSSANAPTNRRGRKQSLTEDPSKTFVCTLCSRRFRRQEHLKRHYRSLHTQDKPFECNECGKRFSRSDNLAQHARTHGSGAIVMGVLENGELQPHISYDEEMGQVLYEAAQRAAAASSSSGNSSDTSSDSKRGLKKRKRDEISM